jgi:hypothetical protein
MTCFGCLGPHLVSPMPCDVPLAHACRRLTVEHSLPVQHCSVERCPPLAHVFRVSFVISSVSQRQCHEAVLIAAQPKY